MLPKPGPQAGWTSVCERSEADVAFKHVTRAHENRQQGRHREAIVDYENALKLSGGNSRLKAQIFGGLGTVYFSMRQFGNAVKHHDNEVAALDAAGITGQFAKSRALDNLGLAYRYAGKLDAAIKAYVALRAGWG